MAFDSPPFVMDAATVDGEVIRRAIGSLINPAGGIVSGGDLQVTQNGTPNMTVNIGLGAIWVPGSTTSTQGPYYSRNGASISQPINAASASNPRIDTVGVQVQDKAYAGSLTQIAPFYVAGTPTAGANLTNLTGKGAVPASSFVLAYVLVPTSASSIVTADILNVASQATTGLPHLVTVNSSASVTAVAGQMVNISGGQTLTLPSPSVANLLVGAVTYGALSATVATPSGLISGPGHTGGVTSIPIAAGTPVVFESNGTNWQVVSGQQDTGWVAITPTATGFTASTSPPLAARLIGDRVWFRGQFLNGNGGSTSGGTTLATLPGAFASPYSGVQQQQASGLPGGIFVTGSSLRTGLTLNAGAPIYVDGWSYSISA